MRQTVIVGNWKMNKAPQDACDFARALRQNLRSLPENTIVGVAPTTLSLREVQQEMQGSKIKVGAQAAHWEDSGAFTGQVSMSMLKDSHFDFCLIGHSEQREFFGETDETVNLRTKAALGMGLQAIVCVGEQLEDRETGKTEAVIARQMEEGLKGVELKSASELILAYEPVWAIGTGKTATPDMAEEVHAFCRKKLLDQFGETIANDISIQYGGSVKPANAGELLSQQNIDGLLVGGASLDVDSFTAIITSQQG